MTTLNRPGLTPGYSKLPAEYLAESVIKAHTVVAAPGYVVQEGKAIMGNYNHFLTVQELIDLVAFLSNTCRAPVRNSAGCRQVMKAVC